MQNTDATPRHYAVVDEYNRTLSVIYKGNTIAKSNKALILKEVGKGVYNPVFYFPKEDITADIELEESRSSHCPIKGDATYWNLKENPTSDYFAWSYEEPLPRSKKVKGYIAFNESMISLLSEPI